jgi:predicted house-cleaning noncanonical NTP pyrophosphatase (MazG superfamily)
MDINQGKQIQAKLLEKTKHTQEIVEKISSFYKDKGVGVNVQDIIKASTGILANYEFSNEQFPSEVRRLILEEVNKLDSEERVYTLGRLLDIFLYSSLVNK